MIDFNSEGVTGMRAAAAAAGLNAGRIFAVPAMAEGICTICTSRSKCV
jgi:hypothetical protein